jgi:hypothetical protein
LTQALQSFIEHDGTVHALFHGFRQRGAFMTTLLICAALFLSFLVLAIVVAFVYMIMADDDNQDESGTHTKE